MAARTATTVGSEHGAGSARWRGMMRPVAAQEQGAGEARPWCAVEPVETTVLAAGATQKLHEELLAGTEPSGGARSGADCRGAGGRAPAGRQADALGPGWVVGADEVVAAYQDDAGRVAVFRSRLEGETAVLLAASEGGQGDLAGGA